MLQLVTYDTYDSVKKITVPIRYYIRHQNDIKINVRKLTFILFTSGLFCGDRKLVHPVHMTPVGDAR